MIIFLFCPRVCSISVLSPPVNIAAEQLPIAPKAMTPMKMGMRWDRIAWIIALFTFPLSLSTGVFFFFPFLSLSLLPSPPNPPFPAFSEPGLLRLPASDCCGTSSIRLPGSGIGSSILSGSCGCSFGLLRFLTASPTLSRMSFAISCGFDPLPIALSPGLFGMEAVLLLFPPIPGFGSPFSPFFNCGIGLSLPIYHTVPAIRSSYRVGISACSPCSAASCPCRYLACLRPMSLRRSSRVQGLHFPCRISSALSAPSV